jgi:hypothetical protein
MNTPWGKSDSRVGIERGVSWVGTPGHGGLAITARVASRTLTVEALQHAERRGGYYFFEEDCAFAIAFYEIPVWKFALDGTGTDEEIRAALLPGLSRFYADYLIARGITPEPTAYARWQEDQETDRLRAERSPELIVAAEGDWSSWVPKGNVGITTAAGTRFLVSSDHYPTRGYRTAAYPEAVPVSA